jgi:hypothetical protein
VEVLVVWTDVGESGDSEGDESGMADLVGLLKGVDPERPPQGEYEKRDPIAGSHQRSPASHQRSPA